MKIESTYSPITIQEVTVSNHKNKEAKTEITKIIEVDTYEKSEVKKEGVKEKNSYKLDKKAIDRLWKENNQQVEHFKKMIEKLIKKQGYTVEEVQISIKNDEEINIDVDEETRIEAKEAISEDGYWGIKNTSNRILDFAKAISGGDPSKIEVLKGAFKEGYKKAEEAFGGELPEISAKTYKEVMKGFEEWETEIK